MNFIDNMHFGQRQYVFLQGGPPEIKPGPDTVMPVPCEMRGDGIVHFNLFYPDAHTVTVRSLEDEWALTKAENFFVGDLDIGPGLQELWLTVDGVPTLSPYLPIGMRENHPINFVDSAAQEYADVPHGVVCTDYVYNSVTKQQTRLYIYLPPQYFTEPERRFPVLYLQHGFGENETSWIYHGRVNFTMDALIAEGKAVPAIIVMAYGMMIFRENPYKNDYNIFDRFLMGDVLPHVEQRYRTIPDAAHRAMAGLSMGSIQTSRTVFRNPGMFGYMGLFSGFFGDPVGADNSHLTPELVAAFKAAPPKVFFRGIGDKDALIDRFFRDDALLEELGIATDRKIYSGIHEWNIWRDCFRDFVPLLF